MLLRSSENGWKSQIFDFFFPQHLRKFRRVQGVLYFKVDPVFAYRYNVFAIPFFDMVQNYRDRFLGVPVGPSGLPPSGSTSLCAFCSISPYVSESMPRDRSKWNTSIGKGIDTLLNREPGPSLIGSVDTSAAVLQTLNLAESTQSTSNSLAASQAIHRARENLQQALVQIDVDDDVDCSKLRAGNDFVRTELVS